LPDCPDVSAGADSAAFKMACPDLKPVSLDGLKACRCENDRLMVEFSRHVQSIVQKNIDDMVSKRKSFVMGRFLDGDFAGDSAGFGHGR